LLDTPASQLHELPAAWKGKAFLGARLVDRPLAQPLAPDDGLAVRAALDDVIAVPPETGLEPSWPLPTP
jgi:hypothetical protein